jgi:hypothetical protein
MNPIIFTILLICAIVVSILLYWFYTNIYDLIKHRRFVDKIEIGTRLYHKWTSNNSYPYLQSNDIVLRVDDIEGDWLKLCIDGEQLNYDRKMTAAYNRCLYEANKPIYLKMKDLSTSNLYQILE